LPTPPTDPRSHFVAGTNPTTTCRNSDTGDTGPCASADHPPPTVVHTPDADLTRVELPASMRARVAQGLRELENHSHHVRRLNDTKKMLRQQLASAHHALAGLAHLADTDPLPEPFGFTPVTSDAQALTDDRAAKKKHAGVFALQANNQWAMMAKDGEFYDVKNMSFDAYLSNPKVKKGGDVIELNDSQRAAAGFDAEYLEAATAAPSQPTPLTPSPPAP